MGDATVGPASEMQWCVFDFATGAVREYDAFRPTPYFMKTYVPFFAQYAQVRVGLSLYIEYQCCAHSLTYCILMLAC